MKGRMVKTTGTDYWYHTVITTSDNLHLWPYHSYPSPFFFLLHSKYSSWYSITLSWSTFHSCPPYPQFIMISIVLSTRILYPSFPLTPPLSLSRPIIVLLLLPLVPPPSPFDSSSFPTICSEVEEPSRYGDLSLPPSLLPSLLPPPLSPPLESISPPPSLPSRNSLTVSLSIYSFLGAVQCLERVLFPSFFTSLTSQLLYLERDTVNNPYRLIPNFPSWRSIESREREALSQSRVF